VWVTVPPFYQGASLAPSRSRIDRAFPEFAEVGCVWAPQTIYDEAKGKMMIYFTAKIGRGVDDLYYAYTDEAFTKIETTPERYFHFPYPDGPLSDDVRTKFPGKRLELTVPFVLFGIFRYLFLVHHDKEGDDPARLLFTDPVLLTVVLLWGMAVILLIYL